MGIWSRPLFVICRDANGDIVDSNKVMIDFNQTSMGDMLEPHGIIVKGESVSISESFMHMCDTARVYGYFDPDRCRAWCAYVEAALIQNKAVQEIELHMFCGDWDFPYYFSGTRNKQYAFKRMPMGHALYSDVTQEGEEGFTVNFDVGKYRDLFEKHPEFASNIAEDIVFPIQNRWYIMEYTQLKNF